MYIRLQAKYIKPGDKIMSLEPSVDVEVVSVNWLAINEIQLEFLEHSTCFNADDFLYVDMASA
jgi:hypothetical protein